MKKVLLAMVLAIGCAPPPEVDEIEDAQKEVGAPGTVPTEPKPYDVCADGRWGCYQACIRDVPDSWWLGICFRKCDRHFEVDCLGSKGPY